MDSPFNQTDQTNTSGFSFPPVTQTVPEAPSEQPVDDLAAPAVPPPATPQAPVFTAQVVAPSADGSPQPAVDIKITEQKPKSRKDLLLVGLLLILLAGAVFGFTKVRSLLSSAAVDGCTPASVVEQDLTSNSIIIHFTTSEACKMQVAYGVDEVLGLQLSEQVAATDHRIKLTPLMPSTPYRYQIRNGDNKYEPTRGFLTLAVAVLPSPTAVAPTRGVTPSVAAKTTPGAVATGSAAPSGTVTYTIEDFRLHFGSVDPRFDIDKNGAVNIRDWQLYSK